MSALGQKRTCALQKIMSVDARDLVSKGNEASFLHSVMLGLWRLSDTDGVGARHGLL
jgi:hypothetical protein